MEQEDIAWLRATVSYHSPSMNVPWVTSRGSTRNPNAAAASSQ